MFTINNPFLNFKMFFYSLSEEQKEKLRENPDIRSVELMKNAFLYITENFDSYTSNKKKLLNEIVSFCPKITGHLLDEEILSSFYRFCSAMVKKNSIVSPAELKWVELYVKNKEVQLEIEETIYNLLLQASSHWDKMRQGYKWNISKERRLKIVREKLFSTNLGAKRKMELAEEFSLSKKPFAEEYFRVLLYDGHYAKAQSLNVNNPEIVMDCIVSSLENYHFEKALEVAEKFHQDLVPEVQKFINNCPPFVS